ncbi:MAG: GNAT family N-acetyltransferase [Gammaproteobacteria bacterium]|nr:GNAT family N-acetyltransferase [Gammaproteobacteria bacterium]
MRIEFHKHIDEIPVDSWNALVIDNNPFLHHEFLAAMEHNGCVGETFGWIPHHIAIYKDDLLVGAMPLYEKHNSYGEFVFDHAWADAYQRSGIRYFPKLVSAVPYTPAMGQRLLTKPGDEQDIYPILIEAAITLAKEMGMSSFHCLFPTPEQQQFMESANLTESLLTRHDCQFHWSNRGYSSFDDFLDHLTRKKRKNIRQQRKRVSESAVNIRVLDGHTASADDWHHFTNFYNRTFEEKWGMATFNEGFFKEVAQKLPDQIVLMLADLNGETIAGALSYRSDTTLYGRHWGCIEEIDMLHFELCYYQGIEYAIEQGLKIFEPGAQGEHKIARGFLPTLTRSSHWVADARFQGPIRDHVAHERAVVADYIGDLTNSSPYK